MKWRGRQRSSNIEDRRGQRIGGLGRQGGLRMGRGRLGGGRGLPIPIGRGGGIGGVIGIVVILGLMWMLTGQNPIDALTGGQSATSPTMTSSRQLPGEGEDELADFVAVVIAETETMWSEKFAQIGENYPEPTVVLFTEAVQSGCGAADARTGPFYCPLDSRVYIDLSFYEQLHREFGAPGDFAQAYVLAHEVGHHVQNLTGVLGEFNSARQGLSPEAAARWSVRIELQADCYAGIWANYAGQQNLLEAGDAEEAINAASQIGDDAIQMRTQGHVLPKTFSHGTSAQRRDWFTRGFTSGEPGACDTFSGAV